MRNEFTGEAQRLRPQARYYLLEESTAAGPLYGVGAERDGEAVELRAVTASQPRAAALLDILARGQVTPVTLRDVVEDWLLA